MIFYMLKITKSRINYNSVRRLTAYDEIAFDIFYFLKENDVMEEEKV